MELESFFKTIGHFIERMFGSKSVESAVAGTIDLLTPMATAIVELAAPGATPVVTAALTQFQADYATLCSIVQGSLPASGSSAAAVLLQTLESLKSNLSSLLSEAHIKNSANFSKIETYINFFVNELEAITEEFSGASAPVGTGIPQPPAPVAGAAETQTAQEATAPETPAPAPAPAKAHVNMDTKPLR